MKNVLTVQDLSCVGKCSLTVALPVLSAMGISCSVLPTAVLSTHTAFPKPHVRSLTREIAPICDHWQRIGARFDGISIGYLSDPEQAAAVSDLLDRFPSYTVLDPAMGDHGRLYSGLCDEQVRAVRQLCKKVNVLMPNVTEACLLTGMDYQENGDFPYYRQLLEALRQFGTDTVILTGISPAAGMTGFVGTDKTLGEFSYTAPRQPKKCHGTGDLFCAVFIGSCVKGRSVKEAAEQAAAFVERVVADTPKESPFGVEFESHLSVIM